VTPRTKLVYAEVVANPSARGRHRGSRRSGARGRHPARRRLHRRDAVPVAGRSSTAPTSSVHSATKFLAGTARRSGEWWWSRVGSTGATATSRG
jgi:hypothetical protein